MGRWNSSQCPKPTALSQAVFDAIVASVRDGLPMKYAAAAANIGESTLNGWRKDAKLHPDSRQGELMLAVDEAKAQLVSECMAIVRAAHTPGEHGVPDWKANAWILERRFRDEFSQMNQQKITVDSPGAANFSLAPRRTGNLHVEVEDVTEDSNGNGKAK